MKRLIAICLLIATPALAGGTSYTDSVGQQHYQGDDGQTIDSYTDRAGQSHYYSSDGRSGSSWKDRAGQTHYDGDLFNGR